MHPLPIRAFPPRSSTQNPSKRTRSPNPTIFITKTRPPRPTSRKRRTIPQPLIGKKTCRIRTPRRKRSTNAKPSPPRTHRKKQKHRGKIMLI